MKDSERKAAGIGLAAVLTAGAAATALVMVRRKREAGRGSHDSAPGRTARRNFGDYDVEGRSVTIARPRQELFEFWRDFGNLATFMENVESVEHTGPTRTLWRIKAPGNRTVDVETEIAREIEGELIAWRSVPGSDIDTEGRVEFSDAPGERGTRVTAIVAYDPPGGAIGKAIAKMFLREPAIQIRHDLKRFKMLMETGEIATSARRRDETRAAKQEEKTRQHEKEEA